MPKRGRPRTEDATARRRELLRLLQVEGLCLHEAAKQARVKDGTVLKLLWTSDEFYTVVDAIRASRIAPPDEAAA